MSDLEDMINNVLSDPAQLAQITQLAQSLMGGDEEAPAPRAEAPEGLGKLMQMVRAEAEPPRERALLEAMKPYLSEKRRGKIDRALRLAKMAKLAGLALGDEHNG